MQNQQHKSATYSLDFFGGTEERSEIWIDGQKDAYATFETCFAQSALSPTEFWNVIKKLSSYLDHFSNTFDISYPQFLLYKLLNFNGVNDWGEI